MTTHITQCKDRIARRRKKSNRRPASGVALKPQRDCATKENLGKAASKWTTPKGAPHKKLPSSRPPLPTLECRQCELRVKEPKSCFFHFAQESSPWHRRGNFVAKGRIHQMASAAPTSRSRASTHASVAVAWRGGLPIDV